MLSQSIIQCSTEAEIREHAMDVLKEKEICEILNRTYPGYSWHVTVHRMIGDIKCANLSSKMGVRTDLLSAYSASELKRQIVMAGGELLERYRQSRRKIGIEDMMAHPTDFKGDMAYDG